MRHFGLTLRMIKSPLLNGACFTPGSPNENFLGLETTEYFDKKKDNSFSEQMFFFFSFNEVTFHNRVRK